MQKFILGIVVFLGIVGGSLAQQPPREPAAFTATAVTSDYAAAAGGLSGTFTSGQAADLMLSGFGFNQSGGALQFNHPRHLASDGKHLLLSDGNNNRVLIWNTLPTSNQAPDLVIGQPDFDSNQPGTALHQMNWNGQIAISSDGKVVVADTYNDRLLVWNTLPTQNGQAADFAITHPDLRWVWGVWTDGTRLVASATGGRKILFWNQFPTTGAEPPDFALEGNGIGTPRTITSDGNFLMIGDHNAFQDQVGNFVWTTFPTSSSDTYDYFFTDPNDARAAWMQGAITTDRQLIALGRNLNIWNTLPQTAETAPSLVVNGYRFEGGDGSGVVVAEGRVYVLMYNSNKVVVYNQLPTRADQLPDFAIGSPAPDVNTLKTSYIITNPVPATDGEHLVISSDFDRRLYIWNQLPDESGAAPDWVYDLPMMPWDNELYANTLVLGGKDAIAIWSSLPLNGEAPTKFLRGHIGSVQFQDIRGVALDDRYFYVADERANKVYVWAGIPNETDEPLFTLEVNRPTRLSAANGYLAVTSTFGHSIYLYRTADLQQGSTPAAVVGGQGKLNLPQGATLSHGMLFVADTTNNHLLIWTTIEAALAEQPAQVILGLPESNQPQIGQNSLFWVGASAFDGSYLWVGEFKFSQRVLRFSVQP